MTPQEYLKIAEAQWQRIEEARVVMASAFAEAATCPLPENLRPATARDIVLGAVLWYPEWEDQKWAVVEEVIYPGDDFKAYVWEGSRYGLSGAFVEA